MSRYAEGNLSMAHITEALFDNNPIARKRLGTLSVEKTMTEHHEDMTPDWGQRCLYAIDLETSMRGVGVSKVASPGPALMLTAYLHSGAGPRRT